MQLLIIGAVGFAVGVLIICVGRAVAARESRRSRGLEREELLKPFLDWLLNDVIKKEWPLLTGAQSSLGERIAAAGSLISAISVLAAIGGIVSLVLESVPK